MSEITAPRPEVVNGHTDVIGSTSIRHILAVRKSALLQIDTLIRQLAEISVLTESIGGKTALDWAMKQDFRCGCWLMEKPETAMKAITRNLDREIWRDLMQRSGGNDSNLLIVFYVQIMPDDFVMQLHRF